MKLIRVELGSRSYPVMVGDGILKKAGATLARLGLTSSPVVVSNATVMRNHGNTVLKSLRDTFGPSPVISIGDGERFKNHQTLIKIYRGLFRARADRHSWIVAFGGGVVGDLAGFAAATYMRGIPYVNVPTTLLAQVDSAIGGKVGINTEEGKNLVGAFHQPRAVLSDAGVLSTLPSRELSAGLYEVVKCGAIRSEALLDYMERNLRKILQRQTKSLVHVVSEASRIKAEIVSSDEREEEQRMILNYGHTVGHALEAATSYRRFKHGEAVAWGMIAAVGFGHELGLMARHESRRLVGLIHRIGRLPSLRGIACEQVWEALKRDKKSRSGQVRLVLLPRLGSTQIRHDIDQQYFEYYLKKFLATIGNIEV